jgi:hypothetical protein
LAFKLCGYHINCEVSTSEGRVDAIMQFPDKVFIFEFKLNRSAQSALKQIRENGYYKQFLEQNKEIYLIGIKFSGAKKNVEKLLSEKVVI